MEENEIRSGLDGAILKTMEDLDQTKVGTKEHSAAAATLSALYRLKNEAEKCDCDYDEKYRRLEMEKEYHADELRIKEEQLAESKKARIVSTIIEAGGILLPLMLYGSCFRKGLKFEETGAFTSQTFRGLLQKIRPTRK